MQRFRIIISPEASQDIQSIHAWISRDSPDNAAKMIERVLAGIDGLAILPFRNVVVMRRSSKLRAPVRTLPVWPYVVYFRVTEGNDVIVLTVRHGARKRPRL